jgi:hypothetical protein
MFTSKADQLPLKNQKFTVQRFISSAFLPHETSLSLVPTTKERVPADLLK